MSEKWSRPSHVAYPSIWSKFKGRKEIDGVVPSFWIQDTPEEHFEIVVNHMCTGFLKDEPLCKYSGLEDEKESVDFFRHAWREILKNDRVGLICYMENPKANGDPIIAAMNCTNISSKSDEITEPKKGSKVAMILDSFKLLSSMKDPFETLNVDRVLYAMGLFVLPEFRGQGIGQELLKAREPLCKAVGIKASVTAFTATPSQILAERVGFKELTSIDYGDLEKKDSSLRFPGIQEHTKRLRNMYIMY